SQVRDLHHDRAHHVLVGAGHHRFVLPASRLQLHLAVARRLVLRSVRHHRSIPQPSSPSQSSSSSCWPASCSSLPHAVPTYAAPVRSAARRVAATRTPTSTCLRRAPAAPWSAPSVSHAAPTSCRPRLPNR